MPDQTEGRIRIGVSSCLLGQEVRHDGQHKRDPYVADVLGARFELVAVCPEVELRLGVPREPIRLVRTSEARAELRLIGVRSAIDHTDAMEAWARRRIDELRQLRLGGYVFKARSPSCGVYSVPVAYGGQETHDGTGLFARAFREALPDVPVEEEGRLADPHVRASFLARVSALARRPSR